MTMTNDPTSTPSGSDDMAQTGKTVRGRPASRVGYPDMLGDDTEEPRTFLDKDQARQMADKAKDEARQMAGKAKDAAAETLSTLTDRVNTMRDQLQHSAEAARDWAQKQAETTAESAKRLQAERPVMVLSVSAGAALAVGLLAGFVIGRATADEY
jgi:ElaB/YqjD/DUF883 family membrane-anchored ribosome-binding protein